MDKHFRAIILKIQNRLSEDDRLRLHFFLGDDVPRIIRDDLSLRGLSNLWIRLLIRIKLMNRILLF